MRAGCEADGWEYTLSSDDIEDAIASTLHQLESPSEAQLLQAVRHFFDHDAFIDWDDDEDDRR